MQMVSMSRVLGGVLLAACLGVCGCPPVENTIPTANAGLDRTVDRGAFVLLNGGESDDADDNRLFFSWRQTGGTTVSLQSDRSATPSFFAPNAATTLTFELTVSDGVASDTDTVTITVR